MQKNKRRLFRGFEVLVLDRHEIQELLNMREALKVVERAFELEARGETVMPPKSYVNLSQYQGDFRAMPAYIDGYAGIKWVSVYPKNRTCSLPSVMAIIILSDPNTGLPLAIMDGSHITDIRTGAAGGVAVKYLAREDSAIVGIIGAGAQAKTQLVGLAQVLPRIQEVKIFDRYPEISEQYASEMGTLLDLRIRTVDTVEKVTEADIVVTTTTSREPIVRKEYIKPGTHINAIGADAKGKCELEADLLRYSKIVVDHIEQASHSGEINVALSEGILKVEDVYGTLGEIVVGVKKGRQSRDEITIFDSTGLAIQDIICAKLVYECASRKPRVHGYV